MLRIDFVSGYLQHTCNMARHPLFWSTTGSRGELPSALNTSGSSSSRYSFLECRPSLILLHGSAAIHRISSSARSRIDSGILMPSALAVLRFTVSTYWVGCSMGNSAGLAPLRNFVDVLCRAPEHHRCIRAIRHQSTRFDEA